MRKLLNNLALLLVPAFILTIQSCSDDTKADDPVISLSVETINLSRTGLDYQGQFPLVEVTSNIYWKATISATPEIEDGDPWFAMSEEGGHGTTEIDISVTENTSAEVRKATITFSSKDGASKQLVVTQAQGTEVVVMLTEDFGSEATTTDVNEFDGFSASGQGVEAPSGLQFGYEGSGAYVTSTNPSSGEGASGGNNVRLDGGGSQMRLNHFRPVYQTDFLISFNCMTTGQNFDTGMFRLEMSSDGDVWFDIPYYRSGNAAGWNTAQYDFSLAESYTYLYFRFVNDSDEDYHVDDINIVLNIPSENVYELVATSASLVPASLPLEWYLYEETIVQHSATFAQELGSYYVLSESDSKETGGVGILSFETNGRDLQAAQNWNAAIDDTGNPEVSGVVTDDYWLWRVPLEELAPGDYVYIKFPAYVSADGMKYWTLELFDGGEWKNATELKEAEEDTGIHYTHQMYGDGATNVIVEHYIPVTTGFVDDTLKVRLRCAGMVRADNGNIVAVPTSGTARIAGNATDGKPVIDVLKYSDVPEQPEIVISGLNYNTLTFEGGATTAKTFLVKANYLWTVETDNLEWATVTPRFGGKDESVTVSVIPQQNDGSTRTGSITFNCEGVSQTVVIVQSADSGIGEFYGLPQWVECNDLTSTNESGLLWLSQQKYVAADGGASYITWNKGPGNPVGGAYTVSGSQGVLTWAYTGDYWLWTIPVSNAPANTKVSLTGGIRSSAKGPRHLILEWSVDGISWNEVDVVDDVVTVAGTPTPVRYTDQFDITGTEGVGQLIDKEFVITEPSYDFYYIRIRVSNDIAQDLTRFNGTNTGGTHRLTSQWRIEVAD